MEKQKKAATSSQSNPEELLFLTTYMQLLSIMTPNPSEEIQPAENDQQKILATEPVVKEKKYVKPPLQYLQKAPPRRNHHKNSGQNANPRRYKKF